jgi:hypothetical protein
MQGVGQVKYYLAVFLHHAMPEGKHIQGYSLDTSTTAARGHVDEKDISSGLF